MPTIDRQPGRPPAYAQIADVLRDQIRQRVHPPGGALPPYRRIAADWSVEPLTARRALLQLEQEGLIRAEQGRGWYVRERPRRHRLTRSREVYRDARGYYFDRVAQPWQALRPTRIAREPAPDDVARALGVEPGARVLVRDRVMGTPEGVPTQLAASYLPLPLVERVPQLAHKRTGPTGIYGLMEAAGHVLSWTETVHCRMPSPEERAGLDLAPGVPLLVLARVTADQHGAALEVNETRMPGDRFELAYALLRSPEAQ